MDSKMTVVGAMKMKEEMKRSIEHIMLLYSNATGLDVDVQGSAQEAYAECTIQVNLPDKSPLANDVSVG